MAQARPGESGNAGGGVPVVAVVGRPNVGKSSLVNRIIGRREAIVEASPGVTRDRRAFNAEWAGRRFEIIDTGGLEAGVEGLEAQVAEQAHIAIAVADLILFVVDAVAGPTEDDLRVADLLRRSGKPVIVAANKVDGAADEPGAADFYRLGLGDPVAVSAVHGRGSGDLLEAVIGRLAPGDPSPSREWAAAAIVGRPNVGKSSILNALLGAERSIVDASPGTTRDPVDSHLAMPDGRVLRIADTAGMRRRVRIEDPIEYFSWLRSRATLRRVDVVVLVADASTGITAHDQRIAQEIVAEGRSCVLVFNKWDLIPSDELEVDRLERDLTARMRFLDWAVVVRTSAVTKRGMARLLPAVDEAIASHRYRLATAELNRLVRDAQERRPHSRTGGRAIRILYAVQARVSPPTVVLFTTGAIETAYVRYIEHQIRATGAFAGSPIAIRVRQRASGDTPRRP